jgi:hypothetical protein
LERRRKIQAEAFHQVHLIAEAVKKMGMDATPWIQERNRIHLLLLQTQRMCEEHDV